MSESRIIISEAYSGGNKKVRVSKNGESKYYHIDHIAEAFRYRCYGVDYVRCDIDAIDALMSTIQVNNV